MAQGAGEPGGGGGGGGGPGSLFTPPAPSRKTLTPEQDELINRLVRYQEEYESPTKEDMRRSAVRPPAARSDGPEGAVGNSEQHRGYRDKRLVHDSHFQYMSQCIKSHVL